MYKKSIYFHVIFVHNTRLAFVNDFTAFDEIQRNIFVIEGVFTFLYDVQIFLCKCHLRHPTKASGKGLFLLFSFSNLCTLFFLCI